MHHIGAYHSLVAGGNPLMPCVSQFYGITIYMYYNDHAPPHFHAEYAEDEALFGIDTLQVLRGRVPRRVRALVVEWATLHHGELVTNWNLARQGVPLQAIEPLD
jgi:hypothetical protein